MTEETIAQEAALDALGAIAFAKGCYTGQEVVARIHFRGHVNRLLRRLRAEHPLTVGAVVQDASGADVGDVRSSVTAEGESLAVAMVRREVPAGDVVQVVADTGVVRAVVEALP
jgi:folate-binding protein YgfZ